MKNDAKSAAGNPSSQQRMFIEKPIIPDFVFGVLRRKYFDHINNAVDFIHAKLHPVTARVGLVPSRTRWEPTAHRYAVLLPAAVPDVFSDPRVLVQFFEDSAMQKQKDLVVMLKLTAPADSTLHEFWENVRAYSRLEFVEKRSLSTVMALHVPGFSGAKTPARPHIHVMVLPRTISKLGFLGYCDIANSESQAPLVEAWRHSSERKAPGD